MNFQRDEWLLSKQRWETKTCPNSAHGSAIPHDLMHLVTSIPQSRVFSFRCWHLFKVSKTPCSNPLNSYSLPIFSSILCPRQSSHHRCNNICIEKRQTSKHRCGSGSNSTKQTIKLRGRAVKAFAGIHFINSHLTPTSLSCPSLPFTLYSKHPHLLPTTLPCHAWNSIPYHLLSSMTTRQMNQNPNQIFYMT